MKVTFSDINKRISRLESSPPRTLINVKEAQLYTRHNGRDIFLSNNAFNSIENWESLDENTDVAFGKALDIFEELCLNATSESMVRTACDILLEGISKVRNQTQLMNSLKNRFGRLQHKSTVGVEKAHSSVTSKIQDSIANIQNTLKNAGLAGSTKTVNIATTNECFNQLQDRCAIFIECDRIVKNYATISKRFNLDKIISNIRYNIDNYQACFEIASCIDTYNQSFKNRYNSALETAAYVFDKHFMNYPKDKIVEAVTDYFLFTGSLKEEQVNDVKDVMRISVLFEQKDFSSLSWVDLEMPPEPIDNNVTVDIESYGTGYEFLSENDLNKAVKAKKKEIKKDVKKTGKIIKKAAKEGNPEEHRDEEVKEMVAEFRASCLKNKDSKANLPSLKSLITKLFAKNPYQIVYELPNLLSLIRVAFIITLGAIHPVIMVCSFIVDQLLKVHFSRKQLEKIVNAYKNEIDSVKSKIEKTKDTQTKENLEKYLEELNKDLTKIKDYERELYTEEENDERDYADYDFGDDDFDFDFDDDEFNFEEAAAIQIISSQIDALSEALIDDTVDGIVYNNIFKLDNDSIDAITDFSITVPVILEKDKLKDCLCSYRNELRESITDVKDYVRINCLNDNILKLETANNSYITTSTTKDAMHYLQCLNEIAKIKSDSYIMEMDFTNSIKLAIKQLKANAVKLKDKDKQISSTIDVAANNTAKSIENALMNGNREAVIKGSMIPSASKCIKAAIMAGVAWAVNPAVAVIGAIGAFACSKKLQKKERQLVLDDIEIELKMCERYLRQAEDEGDMKKVRQIEIIQRNLERQKQRIQYKMVVIYNQRVPDIESVNN